MEALAMPTVSIVEPWEIPFRPKPNLVNKVHSGFASLLTDRRVNLNEWVFDADKRQLDPSKTEDLQRADLAYIPRRGEPQKDPTYHVSGGRYDEKEMFHFHPAAFELLGEHVPTQLTQARLEWLQDMYELWRDCRDALYGFARWFDEEFPGHDLLEKLRTGENRGKGSRHILRLIRYSKSCVPQIGKSHFDISVATLFVDEKWPALVCPKTGKPFRAAHGHSLVLPGRKFEKITKGLVKATQHAVIDTSGRSTSEERTAIVFFGHSLD